MTAHRWLILLAFAAPLGVLPGWFGVPIPQAKNAVVILLAMGLVVWMVRNWWLRAFLLWAFVPFWSSGMRGWAAAGMAGLFAWALVYQQASTLSPEAWARVRTAIALAALIQVAWMGVQVADADPLFRRISTQTGVFEPGSIPVVGWFGNRMDLALFLGLSLPALAALSPWLVVGVSLVSLWLLKSTVGLICLAIVLAWWAWTRGWRGRLVGIGLGLVGLAAVFFMYLDPPIPGGRPTVWVALLGLALQSPWVGWGPNALGYRVQLVLGTNEHWTFGFNEWLQGTMELGWPALVLAGGFLGSLAWRSRRKSVGELWPAFFILIAVSLFSIPLRVGPAALLAALYLGRMDGLTREA